MGLTCSCSLKFQWLELLSCLLAVSCQAKCAWATAPKTIQLLLNSLCVFLPELFKSVLGGLWTYRSSARHCKWRGVVSSPSLSWASPVLRSRLIFSNLKPFSNGKTVNMSCMCLKHREFDMQFWSECKLLELWICDTEIFNLHCLIML